MACPMASSKSWSRKGLVRNSTAPAFMACTDIGMSPWPVMNTIGIWISASLKARCRSRPLNPGKRTSRTRQEGASRDRLFRNSCAEPKVSTLKPADWRSRAVEMRTSASSSTTNTVASISVILVLRRSGQDELQGGAGAGVAFRPQPSAVCLDDRAADRETHAHPHGFGGIERAEDALQRLRVEPDAGILHGDEHPLGSRPGCSDHQLPRPLHDSAHGFAAVHHQIQEHLLELDAIAQHGRQIAGEFRVQPDPIALHLMVHQRDNLFNDVVDLEPLRLGG